LDRLNQETQELLSALIDVSFDETIAFDTGMLFLSKGCPELNSLSPNFFITPSSSISCDNTNLLEEKLN
jgi:hypothetical protein